MTVTEFLYAAAAGAHDQEVALFQLDPGLGADADDLAVALDQVLGVAPGSAAEEALGREAEAIAVGREGDAVAEDAVAFL